ncbi:uncharacterized protein LOC119394050 [Rhipicephalus sanguineus]|nr:uncharacterized protein LOC119394050 [Rhipicephalus sanguineus]
MAAAVAAAGAEMAVYRQKRPNWTEDERLRLVQEIGERIDVIRGKLGPTLTLRAKRSAWTAVQQALNAGNDSHTRTVPEIKKQWSNLVQRCKHRVNAHNRGTSRQGENGRSLDLSIVERTILDVIGDDCSYADFLDGAGPDICGDVDGSQDNCLGSSEDETLIQSLDSSVPEWFWKTSARASGAASASAALCAIRPSANGAMAATVSMKREHSDDDEHPPSAECVTAEFEGDDEHDDVAEALGIVYERPTAAAAASGKQPVPRQATCSQMGAGRRPAVTPQQRQTLPPPPPPPPQLPANPPRRQPSGPNAETGGDGEDTGNRCEENAGDDELATLRKTLLVEQIRAAREQARAFQAVASAAQAVRDCVARAAKSRVHTEKVKRRKLALQMKKMAE